MANGNRNKKKKKGEKKVAKLEKRWEKQASKGRLYTQPNWGEPQQMSIKDIRGYERQLKKITKATGTSKEKAVRKKYDYDHEYASKIGVKPDKSGHRQSIDPKTGKILKGRKHPTMYKTKKTDKALGYKHKKIDGEWYSLPKPRKKNLRKKR